MSKPTRSSTKRLMCAALVTLVAVLGTIAATDPPDGERLLQNVLSYIRAASIDSLTDSTLFMKAAKGLVHQLNDPYAELYSPEQVPDFRRNSLGDDYAGLGLGIESLADSITIMAVYRNTPAEKGGLQRGDRIVAIDSTSVIGWSTDKASKVLTGVAGSRVRLTVVRTGVAEPLKTELHRAIVHVPSVPYTLLVDGHIGYVPLLRVNETATEEVQRALIRLHERGANAYVLDMRGNPGGQLDQALGVSNLFLDEGMVLATVRSRSMTPEVYQATSPPTVRGMPVVILQDGYTASAAEIIAGALQDHDRALVVGMPSFGKGLVQTAFPLADGWLLKMTTGKWYTPSGRSIHRDRPFSNGRFVTVDTPPLGRTAAAIRAGRPHAQSDAGRVLYGGGGIVPDVIVPADTLTDPEQHLMAALRAHGSTAGVVLYRLARDLEGTVHADFIPSPAWRELYAARLRSAGVVLNRALIDSAGPMVDDLIAGQLDQIAFGDSAAFTRAAAHDVQFLRAVKLLDNAPDLTSLLDAARRDG